MRGDVQAACGCSRICGLSVAECVVVVGVVIGGIEGLRQGRRNACCEAFGGFTPTCTGLHGRPKCGSGFGRGVAQPVLVAACWRQGLVTSKLGPLGQFGHGAASALPWGGVCAWRGGMCRVQLQ
jgi:hypothetical protein